MIRDGAFSFEDSFGIQPLQFHFGVIDELHRGGKRAMAGLLCDQRVHPLTDSAIRGMSLRSRAQLDEVHGSLYFAIQRT